MKMIDTRPLRDELELILAKLERTQGIFHEADHMPVASLLAADLFMQKATVMLKGMGTTLEIAIAQLTEDDMNEYAASLAPDKRNRIRKLFSHAQGGSNNGK